MAYVTVKRHLEDIKDTLALPSNCIEFGALSIGASFAHRGTKYVKCPQATDRFGGYNAENGDGGRKLFLHHETVERTVP